MVALACNYPTLILRADSVPHPYKPTCTVFAIPNLWDNAKGSTSQVREKRELPMWEGHHGVEAGQWWVFIDSTERESRKETERIVVKIGQRLTDREEGRYVQAGTSRTGLAVWVWGCGGQSVGVIVHGLCLPWLESGCLRTLETLVLSRPFQSKPFLPSTLFIPCVYLVLQPYHPDLASSYFPVIALKHTIWKSQSHRVCSNIKPS